MAIPRTRETIALVAVVALASLVGCGRLGFDPVGSVDDARGDGRLDDGRLDDGGLTDGAPPACKTNANYMTDPNLSSTYRVASTNLDWNAAKADCESDGAHLPIVDDGIEAASPLVGDWIGITDEVVEEEWRTIDGDLAQFLPWASNEPGIDTTENCGRLDDSTQTFEARDCAETRDYSCECE